MIGYLKGRRKFRVPLGNLIFQEFDVGLFERGFAGLVLEVERPYLGHYAIALGYVLQVEVIIRL